MSGGFFRGTSADQDTRFSNKQAKLMKSQKFAPELEHLVDMKKVKMDVMRPWIANRVTELLGFEDEVLINFIYGLLDAKEVNGKEVQISLTGFMEKNTGKFMKELWTLLLSAQKNESGVPQQFLDAKEEETRKKQAEVDRITKEIQRKKEKESKELEWERPKKMDGGAETKASFDALESASKNVPKGSSGYQEDEKEAGNRNGTRGRNRFSRSPESVGHSSSPSRGSPSRTSSDMSRSLSRSPEARRRAISPNRVYHSPRRSVTPRRRYSSKGSRSPSKKISSYHRQRSRSPSVRRSPSPVRRRLRSPIRRRSPSPIRRRSPSPIRRRRSPSPVRRRRSPSPDRRRRSPSPVRRRRSPSPVRRRLSRSPARRRRSPSSARRHRSPSPARRRRSPSPARRRRSPSPLRSRRSSSPMNRRSPSPVRRGRSPVPIRRRSPSPMRRRSPIPRHRSPSPVRSRYQRSPSTSLGESPSLRHRFPMPARRRSPIASPPRSASPCGSSSPSPVRHRIHSAVRTSSQERRMPPSESPEQRVSMQEKSFAVPHRPTSTLRSQQQDLKALSPSPRRFPVHSQSSPFGRTRNSSEDRRSNSPHESPVRHGRRNRSTSSSGSPARRGRGHVTNDDSLSPRLKPKEQKPYRKTPESVKEDEDSDYARDYKVKSSQKWPVDSSMIHKQKDSLGKIHSKDEHSERVPGHQATESRSRLDIVESRRRDQEIMSEKGHRKRTHPQTPERHVSPVSYKDPLVGERQSDEKDCLHSNNVKDNDKHHKLEIRKMVVEKVDQSNGDGAFDTGTEGNGKRRTDTKEKRRHKRSHREKSASDNDDSSDSEIEEKKEAKRRRKEEKKQRKEEKRRRREERRRRREERRAEKLKRKDPNGTSSSDDEHSGKRESHPSDGEDTLSEQKKLEIELRKKAIESLKAKKGISH